jgi:hypothetical protein
LAAHSWTLLFIVDAAISLLFGVAVMLTLPPRPAASQATIPAPPDEPETRGVKPLRDPRLLWLVLGLLIAAVRGREGAGTTSGLVAFAGR